jgi:hypothetical protein
MWDSYVHNQTVDHITHLSSYKQMEINAAMSQTSATTVHTTHTNVNATPVKHSETSADIKQAAPVVLQQKSTSLQATPTQQAAPALPSSVSVT